MIDNNDINLMDASKIYKKNMIILIFSFVNFSRQNGH